ncbi:MAG: helix-turn-helix domain-containing protein [Defluviitaleaceae bacterium]|nr:helix-turn-helix domain-containing protein [Defluviitaleaceae bacterium]
MPKKAAKIEKVEQVVVQDKKMERTNKVALRKEMGTRLRNTRIQYGLTVDELAEHLKITPSYLGLIERGDRGINAEKLVAICQFFKCSADFMLTGKERLAPKVPAGTSQLAVAIDLLLTDNSKHRLADFIKSLK